MVGFWVWIGLVDWCLIGLILICLDTRLYLLFSCLFGVEWEVGGGQWRWCEMGGEG